MRALPYTGGAILLVAAAFGLVYLVRRGATAWERQRREMDGRRARWAVYCRPNPAAGVAIGLERVWRGHVFEHIGPMWTMPKEATALEVAEKENAAKDLAVIYNSYIDGRGGER